MREPTTLPTARPAGRPFDPPAELAGLRAESPLRRMSYPDGHEGWLATGYDVVRAVLADPRFSSRYELMHFPFPEQEIPDGFTAPLGDLTGIDPPEHTRYRKLLAGRFTVRRMRLLTARVGEVTARQLDVLAEHGPPADLVTMFAQPVPALLICELLGVPYADHELFQRHTATLVSMDSSAEEKGAAINDLYGYLHELVIAKRVTPTDDVLSDLTRSDLTDGELAGIGAFLLGAGLDTTASMLALGTFALLCEPAQFAALRDDPERAVEELLRYLTVGHTGVRAALEDVELAGETIRAGESVTLALQAADRDPSRFPDPDVLDVRRQASGHLAFGHGAHQCLGQQLARVELRVAFPALAERFPTLRLAVDPAEVPMRGNANIHGVHRLPVTWDR